MCTVIRPLVPESRQRKGRGEGKGEGREGKRGLSAQCCARVTVGGGRSRKGEWVVRIRWKKNLIEGDETPDR